MSMKERITQELSLSDVVSKTFELYRKDFWKYTILFLIVEAIVGVLTTIVRNAVILPKLAAGATAQEVFNWLPGFFGALILLVVLTGIATWVLYPVAYGGAVKLASEEIESGQADLAKSVRSATSRILWIWVVGLIVGIIVALGFIALVIPGIILAIMFSLVLPVLIIEGTGFDSMGRSRKLVTQRWLKSLALFIVFGIIVGIASAIAGAIAGVFGSASTIVSSLLSAFYLPLIPIALTVYYYSNVARITPPPMGQPTMSSGAAPGSGVKFCASCGSRLEPAAMFCPSCGARQPV